jgi:hypothetical protein
LLQKIVIVRRILLIELEIYQSAASRIKYDKKQELLLHSSSCFHIRRHLSLPVFCQKEIGYVYDSNAVIVSDGQRVTADNVFMVIVIIS